jgi:nucleoside-diphosphate-sugar epimerase
MPDVLIFGCGYVGKRAAARWRAEGRSVAALTRSKSAELAALGIEPIAGDVCDPESLRNLPRAGTVLYAIGLDRSAGRSMREVYVQGLANVQAALPEPDRFIHISSTSVYGQTDGGWVNEDSGKVVLDAERLLKRAIILRFAGIYGPGRLMRKQALVNGELLVADCEIWLNLTHVDDGVEAILAAEAKSEPGSVFNIADGSPVSRREFYTHWAKLLGAPEAKFDHRPEPGAANRRIAIDKAKMELGWAPRVASHRDGLAGLS